MSNTSFPPACNNRWIGALKSLQQQVKIAINIQQLPRKPNIYPSKASLRALCLTQSLSISSTEFGNLCLIFNFGSLEVLHFNFKNENVLPVLDVLVVVVVVAVVVVVVAVLVTGVDVLVTIILLWEK